MKVLNRIKLKKKSRPVFSLLIALLVLQTGCLSGGTTGSDTANDTTEEQSILLLINEYRALFGRNSLEPETSLTRAAQSQSSYMNRANDLTHIQSPPLETSADRISYFGGDFAMTGEVIAYGNLDAQATLNQWKSSPTHQATVLSPYFSKLGISRSGYYWTVTFGGN